MAKSRIQYLDGLRGIACLIVVADHYSQAFQPGDANKLWTDGGLAVGIFFLMSGFVLTGSFMRPTPGIMSLLGARAYRLFIPAWVAVAVAGALIWGFQPVTHAAVMESGSECLARFAQPPSITSLSGEFLAVAVGFRDLAFMPLSSFLSNAASADRPVWTISYELYGSILIMVLCRIYQFRRPWWLLAIIVSFAVFGFREIGLFAVGHICRFFWRADQAKKYNVMALAAGLGAVLIFQMLHINLDAYRPRLLAAMSGFLPHYSPLLGADALAAMVVFFVVLYSSTLQRCLCAGPLLYLGRLSFSIYLIHWPLMLGLGSTLYLLGLRGWFIYVIGVMFTIALAAVFEHYVDAPAIALSRRLKRDPQPAPLVAVTSTGR